MHFIEFFFQHTLQHIALIVSLVGVIIILIGSINGLISYLLKRDFHQTRRILNQHLILGLDFLIGVDIIETLMLSEEDNMINELIGLTVVVVIRIVLTYFTSKELKELDGINLEDEEEDDAPNKPPQKKHKHPKTK